jgi:hypothetical protein
MKDPKQVRKDRYKRNIEYIDSKRDVPCADCGNSFPIFCMDFHHIDEQDPFLKKSKKTQSVKHFLKRRSRQKIDEELDKCVVLCANCHRIRHHQEA